MSELVTARIQKAKLIGKPVQHEHPPASSAAQRFEVTAVHGREGSTSSRAIVNPLRVTEAIRVRRGDEASSVPVISFVQIDSSSGVSTRKRDAVCDSHSCHPFWERTNASLPRTCCRGVRRRARVCAAVPDRVPAGTERPHPRGGRPLGVRRVRSHGSSRPY